MVLLISEQDLSVVIETSTVAGPAIAQRVTAFFSI
jgi:hypothetical protein